MDGNKCSWLIVGQKILCNKPSNGKRYCANHIKRTIISKPCEKYGCGTQAKLGLCKISGCGYDKKKRDTEKIIENKKQLPSTK